MGLIQKIRGFAGMADDQRVRLDRRAFLRGMAVTASGLLVPRSTVFDVGRVHAAPEKPDLYDPRMLDAIILASATCGSPWNDALYGAGHKLATATKCVGAVPRHHLEHFRERFPR